MLRQIRILHILIILSKCFNNIDSKDLTHSFVINYITYSLVESALERDRVLQLLGDQ